MTIAPEREDLKLALHKFMEELSKDIARHLGGDIPFVAKLDVHLGSADEHKTKLQTYAKYLVEIMDSVPKEYMGRNVP